MRVTESLSHERLVQALEDRDQVTAAPTAGLRPYSSCVSCYNLWTMHVVQLAPRASRQHDDTAPNTTAQCDGAP